LVLALGGAALLQCPAADIHGYPLQETTATPSPERMHRPPAERTHSGSTDINWLETGWNTAMKTIGAFEAKTHLSRLLEEVEHGEDVLITRHGRAVARLVAAEPSPSAARREALERLRMFRSGKRLQGVTIQELRDEGRRP